MGGPCEETTDCAGGLVCEAGTCTQVAADAPVASQRGVLVIVAILVGVGAATIFRQRLHT